MILAGAKHGHGPANTMIEEARSCLYAVQSVFEYGARIIIIEGDCISLINMLKSSQIYDTAVGFYVRDILSLVK